MYAMRTLVLLPMLAAFTLSGCSGEAPLEAAYASCKAEVKDGREYFGDYAKVGDEGRTITITRPGSGDIEGDQQAFQLKALDCLLAELDVSDAVDSQMDQTTAMMGRQEESWGAFTISWSYHPDSGVSAVITESDD